MNLRLQNSVITQKVVSVKCKLCDVCGREFIVIYVYVYIYRYNNYFVYKINYICIYGIPTNIKGIF